MSPSFSGWAEENGNSTCSSDNIEKKDYIDNLIFETYSFNLYGFEQHLLLVSTFQVPPFFDWTSKVNGIHGYLHLPNDVMFGEPVIVVHRHDQRFPTQLLVGHLKVDKFVILERYSPGNFLILKLSIHKQEGKGEKTCWKGNKVNVKWVRKNRKN